MPMGRVVSCKWSWSPSLTMHACMLCARARAQVEALLDRSEKSVRPPVSHIVEELEKLGYNSWAHRVVCSTAFGTPNRRRRVFIVASMHGDARDVLLSQGGHRCLGGCRGVDGRGRPCWECYEPPLSLDLCSVVIDEGNARNAPSVDIVPTFTTTNNRMLLVLPDRQMGLLRIEDAERLQGLPEGHTAFPKATTAERFKMVGNAINVGVAAWIGRRLADPHRYKYVGTAADRPMPQARSDAASRALTSDQYAAMVEARMPSSGTVGRHPKKDSRRDGSSGGEEDEDASDTRSSSWPRAAYYERGAGRWGVHDVSAAPEKLPFVPLGDMVTRVEPLTWQHGEGIRTYLDRMLGNAYVISPELLARMQACDGVNGPNGSNWPSDDGGRQHAEWAPGVAEAAAEAAERNRRCGACNACLSLNKRRCFVVRANEMARGGHAGGLLAVHGSNAIGAKIEVWWPVDRAWYPGRITGFNVKTYRHNVLYDDNEKECLCLWEPSQMVRVLSPRDAWPAEAGRLRAEAEAEADKKNEVDEELTQAEQNRARQMAANRAVMRRLFDADASDEEAADEEASDEEAADEEAADEEAAEDCHAAAMRRCFGGGDRIPWSAPVVRADGRTEPVAAAAIVGAATATAATTAATEEEEDEPPTKKVVRIESILRRFEKGAPPEMLAFARRRLEERLTYAGIRADKWLYGAAKTGDEIVKALQRDFDTRD